MDIVGYGVQERNVGGGPPQWVGTLTRYYAPSQLVASESRLNDLFDQTSPPTRRKVRAASALGTRAALTCWAGRNILGVNAFVTNGNCAGVTYSQRVDLADVLEFIEGFL